MTKTIILYLYGMAASIALFASDSIETQLRVDLAKRYPDSKISFLSPIELQGHVDLNTVTLLSSQLMNQGTVKAQVVDAQGIQTILHTRVDVQMPAYIAKKRIYPGNALKNEDFAIAYVSLNDSFARENSSFIVPPKQQPLEGLEAKNSILEGSYILSTVLKKITAIKRGDPIQIKLSSDS
jgi:flagella basal body P-ring formation protein FlgA